MFQDRKQYYKGDPGRKKLPLYLKTCYLQQVSKLKITPLQQL